MTQHVPGMVAVPSNRAANESCLREHPVAENRHEMEATLATLRPDGLLVEEPGLDLLGRDAARKHATRWWSGFANTVDDGQGPRRR